MRRNSLVALVSQRTMLHHWLIFSGKSRQLRIHFEKVAYMMVSDVGRTASFSSSGVSPPWVTQATSGVNPAKCSASFLRKLSGMNNGEVDVPVPGCLDFLVEGFLDFLPHGDGVFADYHAALDGRVIC